MAAKVFICWKRRLERENPPYQKGSFKRQSLAVSVMTAVSGIWSAFSARWALSSPYPAVKALICLLAIVLMQLGLTLLTSAILLLLLLKDRRLPCDPSLFLSNDTQPEFGDLFTGSGPVKAKQKNKAKYICIYSDLINPWTEISSARKAILCEDGRSLRQWLHIELGSLSRTVQKIDLFLLLNNLALNLSQANHFWIFWHTEYWKRKVLLQAIHQFAHCPSSYLSFKECWYLRNSSKLVSHCPRGNFE